MSGNFVLYESRNDVAIITLNRPEALNAAATLTVYAAGSRYPGPGGEILEAEYRQATALAQRVLDWAEHLIRRPAENEVTEGCG